MEVHDAVKAARFVIPVFIQSMVKPDLKINAITKIEASFVKKKKKKEASFLPLPLEILLFWK